MDINGFGTSSRRGPEVMDATQHYSGLAADLVPDSGLKRTREKGLERLQERGFPAGRDEDWKYTNARLLLATPFVVAPKNPDAVIPSRALGGEGLRWVFVDGHARPDLSSSEAVEGLTVTRLSDAGAGDDLDSVVGEDARGFDALNSALVSDGLRIDVAANVQVAQVLHIIHLQTSVGLAPLRVWIHLGRHAECTVVEHWLGEGGVALTSAVTEIRLQEGARLRHLRVQDESLEAFHVGTVAARLSRDSDLHQLSVAFGGRISRVDVRADLDGPGASVRCDGVYLGRGQQHMDHHTVVRHHAPHTNSNELYKGVLDDKARGVFTGRVVVDKDAQQIASAQSNNNLLLSDDAVANSRPQLEIFADDVQCSHGATIGRLDPDALFYLRARGLDPVQARSLLTVAFAREVLEGWTEGVNRTALVERISAWFGATP